MSLTWARALARGGRAALGTPQVPALFLWRPLAGGGGGSGGDGRGDTGERSGGRSGPGGDTSDRNNGRGGPSGFGGDTSDRNNGRAGSGGPGGDAGDRSGGRDGPGGDTGDNNNGRGGLSGAEGDTGDRSGGRDGPGGGPGDPGDAAAALEAALAALAAAPGGGRRGTGATAALVTATLRAAGAVGAARRRGLYHQLLRLLRPPPGTPPVPLLGIPRHLESGLRILEHMEAHGMVPDEETLQLLEGAFGPRSRPLRKAQRMRYWLPRFRHADPHRDRDWDRDQDRDQDRDGAEPMERARSGLRRAAADLGADIAVLQMPVMTTLSSGEEKVLPFIIGAQSAEQRHLLSLAAARGRPLLVEGPLPLWLRGRRLDYFVLRAEPGPPLQPEPPDPERSFYFPLHLDLDLERGPWDDDEFDVDEVAEGPVLALCVPGAGDRATLARWVALLQDSNPALGGVPVLFRLGGAAPPAADVPPLAAVTPPGVGVTPADMDTPQDAGDTPWDAEDTHPGASVIPPDTGDTPWDAGDTPLGTGVGPPDAGDTPRDAGDTPLGTGVTPPEAGDTPRDAGDIPRRDNDDDNDNETPRVLPGDRVRGQG